jgi:hypothetical protein
MRYKWKARFERMRDTLFDKNRARRTDLSINEKHLAQRALFLLQRQICLTVKLLFSRISERLVSTELSSGLFINLLFVVVIR